MVSEHASAANLVKLTGNFLISTVIESMAEAVSLVRKSGVDPNNMSEDDWNAIARISFQNAGLEKAA